MTSYDYKKRHQYLCLVVNIVTLGHPSKTNDVLMYSIYIYLSQYLYIYPYGWQTIGMTLCIHNCSFLDSQLMDDDNLQYRQGGAIPEPAINRGVEAVVSAIFMFVE